MDPFEALIDQAPDGIVVLEGGCVAYLNATAAHLLGTAREDAVGKPIAGFLPAHDAALAGHRIGHLMATGEDMVPADYTTLADPDRVVEIKAKRWEWNGRPAVLAFARDVTERRRFAQQLVHNDRLATIGTLAAGIAHEVNNPITYVQLDLELIESALHKFPGASEAVSEYLEEASMGIARVGAIMRSLRSYARRGHASPGPTDVATVVDAALAMVDNDLRHRARLVRNVAAVPPAFASAPCLEQVLVNVLLNAIRSLEGRESDTISVEIAARSPTEIAILVRDTGCGMPAAVRDRMFDPFFTTKPNGEGMGLGLSVSREIVEAIGGKILVDTAEGQGTTITIVLRAHAGSPTAGAAPVAVAAVAADTRRRVLVVDDEPLVCTLLTNLLAPHHDVVAVGSGTAALSRLAAEEFEVVLCDVMMPGLTGADVYRQIAMARPGHEQRFVFITGGAFTTELDDFLASCGNTVLAKPFHIGTVLAAVANVRLG